jgi:hypothetical protein
MKPSTREELKLYCLRSLGFPVVNINVDDDQLEDRIDEAIDMFQTFHYDGLEKVYTSHQVVAGDYANSYVTMADDVVSVSHIWTLASSSTSSSQAGGFNMWDINYQIRMNELYNYVSGDYTYFTLANQHIRTLEMLFTGEVPIRFNRYTHKLHIDAHWETKFMEGSYFIIECYKTLPDSSTFWGDNWLKDYTTALFKRQWGNNLKKHKGIKLPGGVELDGQGIWAEAVQEIESLEEKLRDQFEQPIPFLVG